MATRVRKKFPLVEEILKIDPTEFDWLGFVSAAQVSNNSATVFINTSDGCISITVSTRSGRHFAYIFRDRIARHSTDCSETRNAYLEAAIQALGFKEGVSRTKTSVLFWNKFFKRDLAGFHKVRAAIKQYQERPR